MAIFFNKLREYYDYIFFDLQDEKVESLYLMNSPLPLLTILSVYYYFIYYGGRTMMANRKPFNLEKVLVAFNAVQIIANLYLVGQSIYLYFGYKKYKNGLFCMISDELEPEFAMNVKWATYLYAMLKISDLMDTVFMVLRKNYHQISFLHVYHHMLMVITTWTITKYSSGGQETMVGMINVFVHVVMYAYYLASAKYPQMKKILWVKKMITQMQLSQFVFLIFHELAPFFMPDCKHSRISLIFLLFQNILMVILFSNFYYKAYYVAPRKQANLTNGINTNNNLYSHKSK